MQYIKQEIYSGDVYEAIQTYRTKKDKNQKRNKKYGKTSAKQKIINEKNALKKLARWINANFTQGDLFLTLTYAGEVPDIEQAKKDLGNFIRRVQYHCKKHGVPELKYIAVTESENKRVHHHVIMSKMSMDIIDKLWVAGKAIMSRLTPDKDYTGLAKYIIKEQPKEFAKRWRQSRNLKRPIIKVRVLKNGRNILKAPKGYKIIEQRLDYTDWTGQYQYIRAIKIGGMDYFAGWDNGVDAGGTVSKPPKKQNTKRLGI